MNDDKKIIFTWDIHLACNYRCPYCWFHGKWEEIKNNNVYPSTDKLISYWKNIYDKYGKVMITIVGGEPLTYPDFESVYARLSEMHDLEITSNLSVDNDKLRSFLETVKGRNIKISASYHPIFAKFDEFLNNVRLLKEYDSLGGVLYLAYPPQVQDIPRLKEIFDKEGLTFSVLTFWGTYEGKKYPDSYTDQEKKLVGISIGKRSGEDFQVEPKKTKGILCDAGRRYAVIHPDGEVLRCGGGGVDGKNVTIGNFFDDDFKLLDKAMPCHSETCPCNEWAFLLLEEK